MPSCVGEKQELQERPQAKRRRKNKLIIDKNIKLSSQFMKSRTENVDVELRCEKGADRISIIVPASILLSRPAHAGCAARSNLGYTLARAFIRNLDVPDVLPADDRLMEIALTARQRRSTLRAAQQSSVAEVQQEMQQELQQEMQQELQQEIQQEFQLDLQLDLQQEIQKEIQPDMDFNLLPTQIVITSPQKRAGEPEHSPKRICRSGFVSFRLGQQLKIMQDANDKENVPQNYQSVIENNKENVADNQQDPQLEQMLEAAGLADVDRPVELSERPSEKPNERPSERSKLRESSETPLGSLDRTKVSLGDSENTTDSKRFIREEWGTHGTMHKIYRWPRAGNGPLSLQLLLARGPSRAGHSRIIAARCFLSLLKLKQHGFINVIKDPETYEILDIQLGNKFIL